MATPTRTPRDAPALAAWATASVGLVAGGPLYAGGGGAGCLGGGWFFGWVAVGTADGVGLGSTSSGGGGLCGGRATACTSFGRTAPSGAVAHALMYTAVSAATTRHNAAALTRNLRIGRTPPPVRPWPIFHVGEEHGVNEPAGCRRFRSRYRQRPR